MAVCRATKRNGEPCTLSVTEGDGYCWAHSPRNSEQRRLSASRAGRAKPSRDLASIKAQLQELADKVLTGEIDRGDAAVAGQLLNIKLRALEVERKWRETDELQAEIEELKEAQEEAAAAWRT